MHTISLSLSEIRDTRIDCTNTWHTRHTNSGEETTHFLSHYLLGFSPCTHALTYIHSTIPAWITNNKHALFMCFCMTSKGSKWNGVTNNKTPHKTRHEKLDHHYRLHYGGTILNLSYCRQAEMFFAREWDIWNMLIREQEVRSRAYRRQTHKMFLIKARTGWEPFSLNNRLIVKRYKFCSHQFSRTLTMILKKSYHNQF